MKWRFVSRDLKPANVLFEGTQGCDRIDWATVNLFDLWVKVGDLGLSRIMPVKDVTLTQAGTPAYWAPEVPHRFYGLSADIYCIGMMTFELMKKRLPYPLDFYQGD